jgi:RNA polymerase sigma-70 factor (ECF subfamily)
MEPAATATALMEHSPTKREAETGDFDAVVQLYWPRVFRFALASLRDRDAAEALTQDCFLHAYKAWERFRGEASIQTWLMRIAVNLVRDAARNRRLQFWKRLRAGDPEGIGGYVRDGRLSPEGEALLREQIDGIWKATATLPERQKSVFLLRFAEEMTLLEIAAATGLSENAVKVHLYRALRTVRTQLGRPE